jgi:hypothetical protein
LADKSRSVLITLVTDADGFRFVAGFRGELSGPTDVPFGSFERSLVDAVRSDQIKTFTACDGLRDLRWFELDERQFTGAIRIPASDDCDEGMQMEFDRKLLLSVAPLNAEHIRRLDAPSGEGDLG